MANTVFENKVIEAKAKDLLATAVNTRSLLTIDSSLAETAGMTKTINVYTYTGSAEELEKGAKNTTRGAISYTGTDYKVKRVQQVFDYFDDDFLTDNTIVDNMLKGANDTMANKMTEDFYAECAKAALSHDASAGFGYDAIVDAIAKLNIEDESKLFVVIPNEWKADLRKDEDYKSARMGEVIYNGQVGTICGIPVIATKATDVAYVMTTEAVKLFMKKDVQVEQDRDIETKANTVALTTYYVCALVDNTKICKVTK
jgi:hypothetical protein